MKFIKMNISKIICVSVFMFAITVQAVQVETPYTSVKRFNAAGQLLGTISPDPDFATGPLRYPATRNSYNNRGLIERVEIGELYYWYADNVLPANWSGFTVLSAKVFQYDDRGRKISETVFGRDGITIESLTQLSYDQYDRAEYKAVRMNKYLFSSTFGCVCLQGTNGTDGPDRITRYTYDYYDQVLTETRATDTPLQQIYVTNTYRGGLITSQIDANGNKTELVYDSNSRLQYRYFPQSNVNYKGLSNPNDYNEYRYDINGNMIYERKRNGAIINYSYDNNNRMIYKDFVNNTDQQDVSYNYDLRGLTLTSRFGSDTGVGVANTFDGFGNIKTSNTTMGSVSRTISYQYDQNSNRTRVTHPDGYFFTYQFDQLNRVNSLNESTSTSASATTNNLLSVTYQNNGRRANITRANGSVTRYNFDNANRLGSFVQDLSGTMFDLTNTFKYNAARQVTELTQSNNLYYYTGNENLAGSYTPNGLNQYTNIAGQAFTYDAKGNLTSDGPRTYKYDDENRLINTSGNLASTLVYDPLGRLFQTTIAGTVTRFLYDGDALIAEYNSSNAVIKRYAHGDQVDEPLVQYNGSAVSSSTRFYLHADHQGSIIAQSNMSGTVNTLAYDTYGIPASKNLDRFGYTGQIWLKELGLFHYKARVYSPKLGRFLQTDPIFYKDNMNMYAYVGNDPVNFNDPSGMTRIPLPDPRCEFNKCNDGLSSNWIIFLPGMPSNETNSSKKPKGPVIDSTKDALKHYFNGNGETASLGPKTISALLRSPVQQEKENKIRLGKSASKTGNYAVDMTSSIFHVGRTKVTYNQNCDPIFCTVTFNAFVGDGFWDANVLSSSGHDGAGPGGELPGGKVYSYEEYEWLDSYITPYK